MSKRWMGPSYTLTIFYMDGTQHVDSWTGRRPVYDRAREVSLSPHCLRAVVWTGAIPDEQKVFAGGRMKTEMLSRSERDQRLLNRGLPSPEVVS